MFGTRREPVFGPAVQPGPRVRAAPEDRVVRGEGASRRPVSSPQRGSSRARSSAGPSRGRRRSRGRGGGRRGRSVLGRLVYWSLVIGVWGVISVVGVMIWVGAHLPPIQSLAIPKRPPTIHIVGLGGRVIATRGDMPGTTVPLQELPRYLPQAFVAIEDRRFYRHFGIDPIGVARAIYANILQGGVAQGGSTLTQQLAKNLFLTQERTIERKIQEIVLALWLERKYSKTQILEVYLNRMYFGAGAYGVEAAARRYFNKSARQVTLAEAAMLAGLVKSPSRLAPTRNPDGAERRAQIVLGAMAKTKMISQATATAALNRPVTVATQSASSANYVADWIMDVLNDRVGRVEEDLVVETSIDPALQMTAEAALTEELAQKGAKLSVGQGAVAVMTRDGAVRALVGGRNYSESQFNRAVSAKRQPGSAFKPFVYLAALERGLTPDTVREDRPIALRGWRPENYKHEYHGRVTLTQALARSMNTVAVRLTLEVGPKAVVKTAHRLGIASKLEPNASIALGTSEVSLMELVSAYAVFANGGFAVSPHVIDRVRTAAGQVRYVRTEQRFGRVVDARPAAMMNAMMQETVRSGTATRASLPGWTAAGKTGTSQDFRDAWFIGYTSHLVTGVWLGNDDGSPTRRITGGGLPVEVWTRVMQAGHRGIPVAGLPGATAGIGAGANAIAVPVPPEDLPPRDIAPRLPRGSTAAAPARASGSSGLDGWLLEKIFGR
ncbi:MAG: PBP1A family penicillin-binding protein [Rhizobiales bacterium]|nr:PBP1A family penicillin-binding protein [Hyphomicrobiales bacterium]